jgi:catechol 2,3-dioxygenase
MAQGRNAIGQEVSIGDEQFKVSDPDRAMAFCSGGPGSKVTQRHVWSAAFLSAGGCHHPAGLNIWERFVGFRPHRSASGLFHLAILYPTRAALADALRRLVNAGISLYGASGHGVSEAV